MNPHTSKDQAQKQMMALRQEAARLADQAKEQLLAYAQPYAQTLAARITQTQSAADSGRAQLRQAASHASDQGTAALATALEDAARQLHSVSGDGPTAQVARQVAEALERGSEHLKPWGARAVIRRLRRGVRSAAFPVLLVILGIVGVVTLSRRGKPAAH